MFTDLLGKAKVILAEVGAVIIAICTFSLLAYLKGRKSGKSAGDAEVSAAMQAAEQHVQDHQVQREEIDNANAQLPAAPTQTVADADPATAAGKLRDEGWDH